MYSGVYVCTRISVQVRFNLGVVQVSFNLGVVDGVVDPNDIDWRAVCYTIATCNYMGVCVGALVLVACTVVFALAMRVKRTTVGARPSRVRRRRGC